MKVFWVLILSLFFLESFGQIAGERLNVNVKRADGSDFLIPWTGGMNNPQFSEADFNNDGIMDLLVFDRTGNVPLTFINNGTANQIDYTFAPEYAKNFPNIIQSWALMADYNKDGAYDIFTYSNIPGIPGIEVHRGFFDAENRLAFELVRNFNNDFDLLSYPLSNGFELEIYAAFVDIPSFLDVDVDGDMDVLNFSQAGDKIMYYENQSAEMGYGSDSLIFLNTEECWGYFIESGTSADILLGDMDGECASFKMSGEKGNIHAGSTMACWDNNGDGDWEILVGDITVNTLSFLSSSATGVDEHPWFDQMDATFPSYDAPINIPVFPAPFVLDVNNDGRKDLIASPNDQGASLNVDVAWYYENTTDSGEGVFNLRKQDFLVEDGIDLGQGAKPAFFDYNADGLLDIVVGTDGYFVNLASYDTRLVLFENIGTATQPEYQLIDEDWLNFSEYSDRDLAPVFGDLDGDGDEDMIVAQDQGRLFYAENTGDDGPAVFNTIIPEYKSIQGGLECVPALGDLDGDGLVDIITGYKQGRMAFFKNIGTAEVPEFEGDKSIAPNIDGMGGVDVRVENFGTIDQRGYASPKVFYMDGDTEPHIVSSNFFSNVYLFSDVMGNLENDFTEVTNTYGDIDEGHQVGLDIADVDMDGYYELIVGNYRGGLSLFDTDWIADASLIVSVDDIPSLEEKIKIVPNPSTDYIEVISEQDVSQGEIGLMDINGRWVKPKNKGRSLQIDDLPSGIYIVAFTLANETIMERILKL